jgi:hypothetical protein
MFSKGWLIGTAFLSKTSWLRLTLLVIFQFYLVYNARGQETLPHSYLSLGTGVMQAFSRDESLAPFVYKGASALVVLGYARQKKKNEGEVDLVIGSMNQKSAFNQVAGMSARFYFLRYSLQREFLTTEKFRLWAGPGISLRVASRETGSTLTGEGIGSFEARVKTTWHLSNTSKVEGGLGLPFVNYMVFRDYGISRVASSAVGWGKFQSLQLHAAYLLALSGKVELSLGSSFLVYNYRLKEPVRVLNQQYFCGLRISMDRNAKTR